MTTQPRSAESSNAEIRLANPPQDLETIRTLLGEYRDYLASFIPAAHLCCDLPLSELDRVPGDHALPLGAFALAFVNGTPAGCAAIRPIPVSSGEQAAELRRMWVRPQFRRRSLGRRLVLSLVEQAIRVGHTALYLDTLPAHMPAAQPLYSSLGFVPVPRYGSHSGEDLAYLRLQLPPAARE